MLQLTNAVANDKLEACGCVLYRDGATAMSESSQITRVCLSPVIEPAYLGITSLVLADHIN